MVNRTIIINTLIQKKNLDSYLEIGLEQGYNFLRVMCEHKESCDPYNAIDSSSWQEYENVLNKDGKLVLPIQQMLTYHMTSDEMFAINKKKYDLIFIDGLHERQQVLRDISNSLHHLTNKGYIVVHDCLPKREECQIVPRMCAEWNGDVWKTFVLLKEQNIKFNIVDTDYGCGIIPYTMREIRLTDFDYNYHTYFDDLEVRNKTLNVISVEQFLEGFIN